LGGKEDADFVTEKVEEMRVENSRVFWIELLDELVQSVKVFNTFAEHLLFDFVVDLIGFVFPVHFLSLKLFVIFINELQFFSYKFAFDKILVSINQLID
jgi:hypothetical protein